jgi:hypothetical protein
MVLRDQSRLTRELIAVRLERSMEIPKVI